MQGMVGDSVLDVVPPTVIAAGGYRFEFSTAPQFQFGEVREEDMIFTVVDSCALTVLSSKQPSPRIALKELKGTVELDCSHNMPCLEVHTVRGEGKHFVSFKPTMVEVARFHPSTVLGARLRMNVINNFGAKEFFLPVIVVGKRWPLCIPVDIIQDSAKKGNSHLMSPKIPGE